jgi:hypothetical protein
MNTPLQTPVSEAGTVDFSRRFMPQELTPLYHAPVHHELSQEQQLRYNQLHALYFNEQIMFFERKLALNLLTPFLSGNLPEGLRLRLAQFLQEEERHSAMFLGLNRQCAPHLYRDREFHFVRIPPIGAHLLGAMSRRPRWFPLFLWLAHLQEERSMYYARCFLNSQEDLEPSFVAIQRLHLADEAGHVRCDEELLDMVWPRTSRTLRAVNARIFARMIGEYFSCPKRGGLRVVNLLMEEFPALKGKGAKIRYQLLALRHNRGFCRSLYGWHNVPKTLERFQRWPEFDVLRRVMPGYTAERSPAA